MVCKKEYVTTYKLLDFIYKHGYVTYTQIKKHFPNVKHIEIVIGLLVNEMMISTVEETNCVEHTNNNFYYLLNKGLDYYRDKRSEKFKVNISLALSILAFCITTFTLILEVLKYLSELKQL